MMSGTRMYKRRLKIAVAYRLGMTGEEIDIRTDVPCGYCSVEMMASWCPGEDCPSFEYEDRSDMRAVAAPAHLEHIIPECSNGPTSLDNTVLACPPCNLAKGPKSFGDPGFQDWSRRRRRQVVLAVLQEERETEADRAYGPDFLPF